jgi:3-deoxy-7-phosphoheptulonate synthase
VGAAARAAVAAGADGLIIEVHQEPDLAVSDGRQSLKPERYAELVRQTRTIAEAVGRTLPDSAKNDYLNGNGRLKEQQLGVVA